VDGAQQQPAVVFGPGDDVGPSLVAGLVEKFGSDHFVEVAEQLGAAPEHRCQSADAALIAAAAAFDGQWGNSVFEVADTCTAVTVSGDVDAEPPARRLDPAHDRRDLIWCVGRLVGWLAEVGERRAGVHFGVDGVALFAVGLPAGVGVCDVAVRLGGGGHWMILPLAQRVTTRVVTMVSVFAVARTPRRSTTTRATLDAEDDVVPGHGVVDGL
jgi:hypothetical protein